LPAGIVSPIGAIGAVVNGLQGFHIGLWEFKLRHYNQSPEEPMVANYLTLLLILFLSIGGNETQRFIAVSFVVVNIICFFLWLFKLHGLGISKDKT